MPSKYTEQMSRWVGNPTPETLEGFSEADAIEAFQALVDKKPERAFQVAQSLADTEKGRVILSSFPTDLFVQLFINTPRHGEGGARTPLLPWTSLRPVGKFPLFKVSYIVLLGVPLLSKVIVFFDVHTDTWFFAALYFGNLAMALGNLVFDVFCPAIIKRFGSPNDLYDRMLDIAAKQRQSYPEDVWTGNLEHSWAAYGRENRSRRFVRVACGILFFIGFLLLLYVTVNRSIFVLKLFEKAAAN
jgi:hypothetical protein